MAEPLPSAATKRKDAPVEKTAKTDVQYIAPIADFLRQYNPTRPEQPIDLLEKRYQLQLGSPLPMFDTKNARAFAVNDSMEPNRSMFALVCQTGTYQRHYAIKQLKGSPHLNLMTLAASGVVRLSQPAEERFVLVYERPAGRKLSDLLAETKQELSENFILKQLIAPVAAAIQHCASLGISHGTINPENIYLSDKLVLGDCLSQPCGYTQPFYFEPIERMQAMPAGKGEGSVAHDYYALAVLALYALFGRQHFAPFTEENLPMLIFKDGIYGAITRQRDVPDSFQDFFRGMLCMRAKERWDERYLKLWLDGKRYNMLAPSHHNEAVRPFLFREYEANSRRELAHIFHKEWAHMPEAMHDSHLQHWVAVSLRNKELAEDVGRTVRTVGEVERNPVQLNEQLMNMIILFDPEGPIRIENMAFHVDGIDSLCIEMQLKNMEKEWQHIAKFIEFNMVSFWLDVQYQMEEEFVVPERVNDIQLRLERLRVSMRNTGFGFGRERILYELNPELPCLSPLCTGAYINSLSMLLLHLDRMAAAAKDKEPIDRHVGAFIASKLGMQHDIRMVDLAAIPGLATNRAMIALQFLALAHDRASSLSLPGLTYWLGLKIMPLLDGIRSRSLRQQIKMNFLENIRSGAMSAMSDLVIHSGYAPIDQQGYQNARSTYFGNIDRLGLLRKGHMIEEKSTHLGYSIARYFAYTAFLIVLLHVLQTHKP